MVDMVDYIHVSILSLIPSAVRSREHQVKFSLRDKLNICVVLGLELVREYTFSGIMSNIILSLCLQLCSRMNSTSLLCKTSKLDLPVDLVSDRKCNDTTRSK